MFLFKFPFPYIESELPFPIKTDRTGRGEDNGARK